MGHNNIIELNGKQYDAISGALLGVSRIKATPEKRQLPSQPKYRGRVIDGFVQKSVSHHMSRPPHAKAVHTTPQTAANKSQNTNKTKVLDIARAPAKQVAAHKAERSQTLMRHAVKKPNFTLKTAIKPTLPTEMMARPKSELTKQLEKKLSVTNVDPHKLAHAKYIAKSQYVRRFTKEQANHVTAKAITLPAQPRPASMPSQAAAQRPQPAVAATHAVVNNRPAAKPAPKTSSDIFEAALAVATSHQQPAPQARQIKAKSFRRRRLASAMAGAGAFIVLAGFIGYLNLPTIQLHVASVQAGFNATAPGYNPTGYARTSIANQDGKVVMQFRSGDSNYQITQEASDWNSQTLLDYYTETYGAPKRTIQNQGRTIYLYDNTRAAWVNGGVRYEISGNAALNTNDLVSLATSM